MSLLAYRDWSGKTSEGTEVSVRASRSWEILRTTLNDNVTDVFKNMVSDTEEIPKIFCKRFNSFAVRNDLPNHYFYREKI